LSADKRIGTEAGATGGSLCVAPASVPVLFRSAKMSLTNSEAKMKSEEILRNGWQPIAIVSCTLTRASRLLRKKSQQPRRLPSPATERARE
jgi:hypothetical protein